MKFSKSDVEREEIGEEEGVTEQKERAQQFPPFLKRKMGFFSSNSHSWTEKSQVFPSEPKPNFFMVPDEVFPYRWKIKTPVWGYFSSLRA